MQIGDDGHKVIPAEPLLRVEEQATVKVVKRLSGRVEVSTRTDTVEEVVTQALNSTKVDVSRHPRNEWVAFGDPVPSKRTVDGVTIVPLLEERLVIEKRLFLVEEIHIRQTEHQEVVTLPVTLRKGRVDISRTEPKADEP